VGKPKTKRLFGRRRRRREDNLTVCLNGIKWEGVNWRKVGMSGGCCFRHGNEPSSYVKTCGIYRLAEDLLASQQVLFNGVVCCRNVELFAI
jgi:hypothetical protein